MEYADLIWDRNEEMHKEFINNLAPIVLFTYNRLDHTRQTIEALQKNVYALESVLYIYSDAPKNEKAIESVNMVRDYLYSVTGFKEIHIIEREENWGLARNIIDGVTKIVKKYGKIIVLEDDIVTSKWFLKYMNDGLTIYKNQGKVMSINGYALPMDTTGIPETYFLKFADCWGWATWDRAWNYFKRDVDTALYDFSDAELREFNFDNSTDYYKQITDNKNGRLYTWAIFWYAAVFKANGLGLMVRDSLSVNIGFDSTGEHCGDDDTLVSVLSSVPVDKFPLYIEESLQGRLQTIRFWKSLQLSFFSRVTGKIKRILKTMLGALK